MSRRVWAHMVARNEAGRYLEAMLVALMPHVDGLHVYDDRSTDATVAMCREAGATVTVRDPASPAFLEDESRCRQAAWDWFEVAMAPTDRDWVLAIDADEILVAPDGVGPAIERAGSCSGVVLPIAEVFALTDTGPWVRTDGFWARIDGARLFPWRPGGTFRRRRMACGSAPTYVTAGVQSRENAAVQVLHLGYADAADRRAKAARYAACGGHSTAHVRSILQPPALTAWAGPDVDVWRGPRP